MSKPIFHSFFLSASIRGYTQFARFNRLLAHGGHGLEVVRMNGVGNDPTFQMFKDLPEIIQGLLIDKFDLSRRSARVIM